MKEKGINSDSIQICIYERQVSQMMSIQRINSNTKYLIYIYIYIYIERERGGGEREREIEKQSNPKLMNLL